MDILSDKTYLLQWRVFYSEIVSIAELSVLLNAGVSVEKDHGF